MTDGFCENYDQSNAKNVQTNDEQSNGDNNDQVKIEELFEAIAIFLFFPTNTGRRDGLENLICENYLKTYEIQNQTCLSYFGY